MIECSSTVVLLTHAVKPDASEVISEAWFYVATWFSIFLVKYGIEDAGVEKAGIFYLIFSQKMGIIATAAPNQVYLIIDQLV